MDELRFGLVGFGAWGAHHARSIEKTGGAKLVAIAAPSERSRASAHAAHPGAEIFAEHRALLDRAEVDILDVVTPSHLHFQIGRDALEAGRHVLMEKPMATTSADCRTLVELARERERRLAVGFELRLSELWGRVRRMIEAGAIGEPVYCLIELWRNPYRPGSGGWRHDIDRVGNWILEEPIHFFDLARWYLAGAGEPESVYARANSIQDGHPELTDNFSAVLNFPGGAYAVISQTLGAFEHHQVAKLTGREGALWASWRGALARDLHPEFSLKHFDGETVRDVALGAPVGEVHELDLEIASVVAAIRHGGELAATGEDGLRSVELCEAAQESVESGRVIRPGD